MKNRQDYREDDEGYSHYKHEDYSYLDLYKKAFEIAESPSDKTHYYAEIAYFEVHRGYHEGLIKEFKALKQIGAPDHGLSEAKWDLFKISMSDIVRNSFITILNCEWISKSHKNIEKLFSQFVQQNGMVKSIERFPSPCSFSKCKWNDKHGSTI